VASIITKPKTGLDRVLYSVTRTFSIIGAVALSIMMLLTVVDVTGRYLFNKPVIGGWEITGLLLVWAAVLGIGYCQMEKGHIRVEFLLVRFPPRVQAIVNSLAYLLGLGGFFVISWQSFLKTYSLILAGDIGKSVTLGWVLWPFRLALAVGTGVMAIVLLVDLVKTLAEEIRR
jgi:TRAP-type C4-dicarboxylate transport system permease small subunit